jgi:hypothetical protein
VDKAALDAVIDPARVRLFIPNGLRGFKQELFERIGAKVGGVIRGSFNELAALPEAYLPVVGCTSDLRPIIDKWLERNREFAYWDRGYARRVFATWLPRGENGGYYRWHRNAFQMRTLRNVPGDRWEQLKIDVKPWRKGGRHIVIAAPTRTYGRFHGTRDWIADTIHALSLATDRQLVIRDKESKRSLESDIDGAHALVTHGSIAAVESVVLGCPVFVHPYSAAALVGRTDLSQIEKPIYPDREPWLHSLAYCQFNEAELVDGTLWRLIA